MNDLELMYLLEENGYEPNIENLKILKETIQLNEARKGVANPSSLKQYRDSEGNIKWATPTGKLMSYAEYDNRRDAYDYGKQAAKLPKDSKEREDLIKKGKESKKYAKKYAKMEESFSDYELYKILDENGYTTTEENLSILKEGIESGKYIIETDEKIYKSDFLGEPPTDVNFDGDERPKKSSLQRLADTIKIRKTPKHSIEKVVRED